MRIRALRVGFAPSAPSVPACAALHRRTEAALPRRAGGGRWPALRRTGGRRDLRRVAPEESSKLRGVDSEVLELKERSHYHAVKGRDAASSRFDLQRGVSGFQV